MRSIVTTDWLAQHLNDPDLRILDCHTRARAAGDALVFEPAQDHYERGHIPGAVYVDVPNDLSRRDASLPLTVPDAGQFAAAMSRYGVDDATTVVLYDATVGMWAARVWWMLRAYGFTRAAVLDGGWHKWTQEGRPITSAPAVPRPAEFVARPQPAWNARRREVEAALGDEDVRVVGVLGPDHARIPDTSNLPATSLVDPETNALLPRERLQAVLSEAGLLDARRVVTYCDAGAMASLEALILTFLGHDNVAVYDGSLAEWHGKASDQPS